MHMDVCIKSTRYCTSKYPPIHSSKNVQDSIYEKRLEASWSREHASLQRVGEAIRQTWYLVHIDEFLRQTFLCEQHDKSSTKCFFFLLLFCFAWGFCR